MHAGSEILHDTQDVEVLRTRRADVPVVIKRLKPGFTPAQRSALLYEAAMLRRLAENRVDGVPTLLAVEDTGDVALVLADAGATALRGCMPMDVGEVLQLAAALSETLAGVHRAGVTHRQINPDHVLWHRGSGVVQLTGFAHASLLDHEPPSFDGTGIFAGTWAFGAPEQTGRIHRAVDWRADLYSLGMTLYALLGGPVSPDAPPDVRALPAHCPAVLAQVLAKLMHADPEQRYQSAYGAHVDLHTCSKAWRTHGRVDAFVLAHSDRHERMQLSQRLFGRDVDIGLLHDAYAQAARGTLQVVWLGGPSGIGKTALVGELQAAVLAQRGMFFAGRYDQLRRHMPFSGFAEGAARFVRSVLAGPPAQKERWRARLHEALGSMGQALVQVAPALQALLGAQPALPAWGPQETENRLLYVFTRFMAALCAEAPVVLFLDDLQWADGGTLKLLKSLVTTPHRGAGLLVVGAFRDTEVIDGHPLRQLFFELHAAQVAMQQVTVATLDVQSIAQLVAQSTHAALEDCSALAALVRAKTGGNAFFTHEVLRALVQRDVFVYETEGNVWVPSLARAEAANITANMAHLLTDRLQQLPTTAQYALSVAACLGNEFQLSELCTALASPAAATVALLQEAVSAGLIVPLRNAYRFAHDQIQRHAYTLLSARDAARTRYEMGRRLLAHADAALPQTWVMTVVGHLNAGRVHVAPAERLELCKLNQLAADQARNAAAYNTALEHLRRAIELLGGDQSWDRDAALAWALHQELATCSLLAGDHDEAAALHAWVVQRAASDVDAGAAWAARAAAWVALHRDEEALQCAVRGLRRLGVKLDINAGLPAVLRSLAALHLTARGKPIAEFASMPRVENARLDVMMRLLAVMARPAMAYNARLLAVVGLHGARLSMRYGNSRGSAHAYALAAVSYVQFGRYAMARQYMALAQHCAANMADADLRWVLPFVDAAFCRHAQLSPHEVVGLCEAGMAAAMEAGAPADAWPMSITALTVAMFLDPRPLPARLSAHAALLNAGAAKWRGWLRTLNTAATCLMQHLPLPDELLDQADSTTRMSVCLSAVVCDAVANRWERASDYAVRGVAVGCVRAMADHTQFLFAFYAAIAILQHALQRGGKMSRAETKALQTVCRKVRHVSQDDAAHVAGAWDVVCALQAERRGDFAAASTAFERATQRLAGTAYACLRATAHECAAHFYERRGDKSVATGQLQAALGAYEAWGLPGKVLALRESLQPGDASGWHSAPHEHGDTGHAWQAERGG